MNKKLIIALIVSALLAAGLLYVRDKKQSEKDAGRTAQAYNKLTEIGKKLPKAGLIKMGTVLKSYYSDNGRYPSRLMDLYPDYIPVKKFIEELEWYYEPRGEDFFLSKTVKRGTQKYAASINQELIPQDGETVLLASVGVKPGSGEDDGSGLGTFDLSILKTAQLTIPEPEEEEKKKEHIIRRPEIVSVTEGEIGEDIPSETGDRFYVWRDKNGALGFGNVSYPDSGRLSIYDDSNWVDIKKPLPRKRKKISTDDDQTDSEKNSEILALAYGNDYLVWRYKDGRLGVGNMQYPGKESPLIYMDGQWTGMRPRGERSEVERPITGDKEETSASGDNIPMYGDQYLIWKSKDGGIGIGNVQYPRNEGTAIYMDGEWVRKKHPVKDGVNAPAPGDVSGARPGRGREKKDKDDAISKLGEQYLVWKYKDGRIGMGNVQYPKAADTAIYLDGKWVKAKSGIDGIEVPARGEVDEAWAEDGKEKKGEEDTVSNLGDQYLVWKYKDGKIGMGNVQYPGSDEIAHIWVNGGWQKVAKETPPDAE